MTLWPSGLRRWLQAPVRKGEGSNPTAVIFIDMPAKRPVARKPKYWKYLGGSRLLSAARLAQSVERQPFKLVVVGSSPTVGVFPDMVRHSLFCCPRRKRYARA